METKHEKIERMAWELYQGETWLVNERTDEEINAMQTLAWEFAEEFYNFAKKKEQEEASDEE